MIARGGAIPRGRSEPGDDQQLAAPLEERSHDLAPIERIHRFSSKDFTPISCCEMRSATALCSSKAALAAVFVTALASSARSSPRVPTPPSPSPSSLPRPLGPSQALRYPLS